MTRYTAKMNPDANLDPNECYATSTGSSIRFEHPHSVVETPCQNDVAGTLQHFLRPPDEEDDIFVQLGAPRPVPMHLLPHLRTSQVQPWAGELNLPLYPVAFTSTPSLWTPFTAGPSVDNGNGHSGRPTTSFNGPRFPTSSLLTEIPYNMGSSRSNQAHLRHQPYPKAPRPVHYTQYSLENDGHIPSIGQQALHYPNLSLFPPNRQLVQNNPERGFASDGWGLPVQWHPQSADVQFQETPHMNAAPVNHALATSSQSSSIQKANEHPVRNQRGYSRIPRPPQTGICCFLNKDGIECRFLLNEENVDDHIYSHLPKPKRKGEKFEPVKCRWNVDGRACGDSHPLKLWGKQKALFRHVHVHHGIKDVCIYPHCKELLSKGRSDNMKKHLETTHGLRLKLVRKYKKNPNGDEFYAGYPKKEALTWDDLRDMMGKDSREWQEIERQVANEATELQ